MPEILSVMNAYKVPVFSQHGSGEVRQGALLSVATSTNHQQNITSVSIFGISETNFSAKYGAANLMRHFHFLAGSARRVKSNGR
jgi:hypothetical protein